MTREFKIGSVIAHRITKQEVYIKGVEPKTQGGVDREYYVLDGGFGKVKWMECSECDEIYKLIATDLESGGY